jgi:hypothetical protein
MNPTISIILRRVTGAMAILLLASAPVRAATLTALDSMGLAQDGSLVGSSSGIHRIGSATTAGYGRNMLVVFQLPELGAVSNPFTTATFSVNFANKSGSPAYNVDLYGLAAQATPTLPTTVFHANSTVDGRPGITLIQQDFATTTTALGSLSTSGGNLLAYLNAQYNAGAGAGQYVVLRFNPDSSTLGTTAVGYNFSSVDNGTNPIPSITYTAIPEPGGGALLLLGGMGLMSRFRPKK